MKNYLDYSKENFIEKFELKEDKIIVYLSNKQIDVIDRNDDNEMHLLNKMEKQAKEAHKKTIDVSESLEKDKKKLKYAIYFLLISIAMIIFPQYGLALPIALTILSSGTLIYFINKATKEKRFLNDADKNDYFLDTIKRDMKNKKDDKENNKKEAFIRQNDEIKYININSIDKLSLKKLKEIHNILTSNNKDEQSKSKRLCKKF